VAQANKVCKICNEVGHSKFYCKKKPFKPIPKVSKKRLENPLPKKAPKPINKVGKRTKAWYAAAAEWKKQNPPDFYGYRYCKVGGAPLDDKDNEEYGVYRLNLCHDKSRARFPSLATDLNNIFAGCPRHNREQGSRSLDEYLASNYTKSCGNY